MVRERVPQSIYQVAWICQLATSPLRLMTCNVRKLSIKLCLVCVVHFYKYFWSILYLFCLLYANKYLTNTKEKNLFLLILASCELQVKFCDLSSPVKVSCGNNWQHYLPCRVAVSFIDHGKCLSYCTARRQYDKKNFLSVLFLYVGCNEKNVKCSLFKNVILDFQVKMGVESSTKFSWPSTSQNRKNEQ